MFLMRVCKELGITLQQGMEMSVFELKCWSVYFKLEVLRWRKKIVKMAGKASVEGKLVAEAELLASFGENT